MHVLAGLLAYLVGSAPAAYFIGRAAGGVDIRRLGTGNMGASNVARNVGKAWGALVFVLDVSKSAVPIVVIERLSGDFALATIWGLCCTAGHCWPAYFRFKGGKGIAVLGGFYIGVGIATGHPAYLIGMAAGYAAGMLAGNPGFASVVMIVASPFLAWVDGNPAALVAGSAAGLPVILARRAQVLIDAWGLSANKAALVWSVVIEDKLPGQALVGLRS